MAGIIGVWQLVNAATTWQGPPTNCTYPGQTNCNTDGVVWNRSDTNFNTLPAQIGNFKISGNGAIGNDFYIPDTKAFRVDKSGDSIIRIGNWGGTGNHQSDLVIYGDLKVEQRTASMTIPQIQTPWLCLNGDCRNVWPSGGGGGGTVTSVGSGNGLTGGPITGSGTLSIMTCANGQILKVSGGVWACGADIDTNSGGTLTGITAGNGISVSGGAPSPTVSINDSYGFGCANGQVRKWNGASWVCSGDATATVGAGTGIIITGTAPNYTVNVDDNRYVNVTGDTMTGSLTVQGNMQGDAISRFGYSGTLGNWMLDVQPNVNLMYTRGTLTHTGALSATGNITSNGTISAASYCFNGTNCISAWPSGGSGDITSVNAGTGLTGGSLSGDATLSIASSYALPQTCNSGWVAKSNGGTSWYCAADNVGTPTTPAGANQQVQFNNNGSFGGDSDLIWDATNNRLGIRYSTPLANIDIGSGGSIYTRTAGNLVLNNIGTSGITVNGLTLSGTVYGQAVLETGTNSSAYFSRSRTSNTLNMVQVALTRLESGSKWNGIYTNGPADSNYVGGWFADYNGTRDVRLVTGSNSIEANGGATIGGNVGIKTTSPNTSLHVADGSAVSLTGDGYALIGSKTSYNMVLHPYHVQARNNGVGVALYLNYYGGIVNVGTGANSGSVYLGTSSNSNQVYSKGVVVTSDLRLKKDISQIRDGLDKIMSLIPVSYKYKAQKETENYNLGFVAQQVNAVLPDLVRLDPESGYYYISYEGVIPVTVKAIQEQQAEIEDLKAKNQELEARLQRLEALIK